MAENACWHSHKRESLFYQQQLCLSFNLEQQTGNQETVQKAIPDKLWSEINVDRTVMESKYIISVRFSVATFFLLLKENTRMSINQPSFKRKAYQFSFISFSFFSSLIFEHLRGQLLSHVPYSKFLPFQVLGDFCVFEDFFFLEMLLCKTKIVFCSDGFFHFFNGQNFTLMWDHLDSLTTL